MSTTTDHLLCVCHATCYLWCDTSREVRGDYKEIARLYYSDLKFEVADPKSPLLARVKRAAKALQAKRGQPGPHDNMTLGYDLPAE